MGQMDARQPKMDSFNNGCLFYIQCSLSGFVMMNLTAVEHRIDRLPVKGFPFLLTLGFCLVDLQAPLHEFGSVQLFLGLFSL